MVPDTTFPLLQPGHTQVLGAHVERGGVNLALIAPNAVGVYLCIFDNTGTTETARYKMPEQLHGIWHGFLPDAGPGLLYGWRVQGPWNPGAGHRFNVNKVLLDPCALEVWGRYDGNDLHGGHCPDDSSQQDLRDNSAKALKARVLADLPAASPLRTKVSPSRRVIYELHTKGFTALNAALPPTLRGTYAGLAHPASISYLQSLGVTTLSLMPVAHRVDEMRLLALGLTNYWGYNPIAWNAPEGRYASATCAPDGEKFGHVRLEFRGMVDALHAAGIEVILDVVYNHSGETDEWGPTLGMRGIDNSTYYHLDANDASKYTNWTGCGNCLNLAHPLVLRMVMDSLRHWVTAFGIDGFRFDLAPVMARDAVAQGGNYNPASPLLIAIAQDPLLRQCTMVAEPWDIGNGGYRLGQFPDHWLEWNDKFRDGQRAFWLRQAGSRGELAMRLSGSTDFFKPRDRAPHSSINFIAAHDGFTLTDLVSYHERNNWANGEHNRDGHGHNLSANFGAEGESDDPHVRELRNRMKRILLTITLLALGTPMLLAGDEMGQSQRGNNNAYCQDNEVTWLDWSVVDNELLQFTRNLIALRNELPPLQSRHWWHDTASGQGTAAHWSNPLGEKMPPHEWNAANERAFALRLEQAEVCLLLLNGSAQIMHFNLPTGVWQRRLDTSVSGFCREEFTHLAVLPPQCVWLLTLLPRADFCVS